MNLTENTFSLLAMSAIYIEAQNAAKIRVGIKLAEAL